METILVAQLEKEQLAELKKEFGFLDKLSMMHRIYKIARFILNNKRN